MSAVLYIGSYYTPEVVESRKLPTRNIAGYNRMRRFAEALAEQGQRIHILSPGITMRCGLYSRVFHGPARITEGLITVTTAPAIGIPYLGYLLEPFFLVLWFIIMQARHHYRVVLLYNFSPSLLLVAAIVKLWGGQLYAQIEDVSIRALALAADARPLQQFVFSICMFWIIRLSHGVVIPTKRFCQILPPDKPFLIITGCMPDPGIPSSSTLSDSDRINVLFAGKYLPEHGVELLMDTWRHLSREPMLCQRFRFHCCGARVFPELTEVFCAADDQEPEVHWHGFLSDKAYRELLSEVHVALALQKSTGAFSHYKTPSKAYEFLAAGKIVVATDVGDLADLAPDCLTLLHRETADGLLAVLRDIVTNWQYHVSIANAAREYARNEFSYTHTGQLLASFLKLQTEGDPFTWQGNS